MPQAPIGSSVKIKPPKRVQEGIFVRCKAVEVQKRGDLQLAKQHHIVQDLLYGRSGVVLHSEYSHANRSNSAQQLAVSRFFGLHVSLSKHRVAPYTPIS